MIREKTERRKFLRVKKALKLRVLINDSRVIDTLITDVSPLGIRFECAPKDVAPEDKLELSIEIPKALNPVHALAKVVWKKNIVKSGPSACEIGCEFLKIEEDNKDTFLKYMHELIYNLEKEIKKGE